MAIQTRRDFTVTLASAALAAAASRPRPAHAAGTVTVWWNQGYFPEEDAALRSTVADWEKKTGNKVDLTIYNGADMPTRVISAITTGTVPDIIYADVSDFAIAPQQAWKGNLIDVSDVVKPVEHLYTKTALMSGSLYNNVEHKRSFYGVPLKQQALHNFYWRPMIEEAGFAAKDIPKGWKDYWNFFYEVQKKLRAKGKRVYGLGYSIATKDSDSYYLFNQWMVAYGGYPVSNEGKLLITEPSVRKGAIDALADIGAAYKEGAIPPSAINWGDPDNNSAFYSKQIVCTPNASLSIPVTKKADKQLYDHDIVTNALPLAPNGKPVNSLVAVKIAFIPKGAKQIDLAKNFLGYFIQPKTIDAYLKAAQGRWLPVMPQIIKDDPFWTDPKDPHLPVAVKQEVDGPTVPWPQYLNPAYADVNAQQVWDKAVAAVVVSGQKPEQAVEEAIKQIQAIFQQYQIPA